MGRKPIATYGATIDDLTEQQRAFVETWLALGAGNQNATEAMRAVNPELEEHSARSQASVYRRDPRILEALRNLADSSLRANVVLACMTMSDIMEGTYVGQPVKPETALKACTEVMNRGGLLAVQKVEHHHLHEDNRSEKELMAHIKKRMLELGVAGDMPTIDAQFAEVDAGAPFGRKKDGSAKQKPGRKQWKTRLLPPPAYKPPGKATRARMSDPGRAKRLREQFQAERELKQALSAGEEDAAG